MEKYRLEMTCGACPEQYDVYKGEELVGYLRLRHGYFYVACPHVGGEVVYEAHPEGDGVFTDEERVYYLAKALSAIDKHYGFDKEREAEKWPTIADLREAGFTTFEDVWRKELQGRRSNISDEVLARRIWNEAVGACASLTHSSCIDHPCPVQERIEKLIVEEYAVC